MNRPFRFALATVLLAAALLADLPPALAVGSTIHVETAADNTTTDSLCTLREAINNANSDGVDTTGGDCETGSGDDEIVFDANYTITLGSELPVVNTTLTITGNGSQVSLIQASACNPVTLPGACTPATHRVLRVESPGELTLHGVTVRHGDCSALGCASLSGLGGGILNTGTLLLRFSNVTGNKAVDGGAVYNDAALDVYGTNISSNAATYGGAIYNDAGTVTITTSSVFEFNTASGGQGGAVYSAGTSVVITEATFANNSANSGGGILVSGDTLTIDRSLFSGNAATAGDGGGLAIVSDMGSSTVGITNSTFNGNSASSRGGAIFDDGQVLTMTNGTIASNTGGGGLYVYDSSGNGPMEVYNSILSGNTGGDCVQDGGVTFDVDAYNQDSDGSCQNATQKTVSQIGLEPLEINDGPTQTMALMPRSSAIDAGDNGVCPDQDQRTRSRPWAYTCDVGAYEFYPCFVDDSAAGLDDGSSWSNAYNDLQTALGNAACTAVWVAEGIYKPGASESDYFTPASGVQLYGGFAGTEELTSERVPGAHPSVLSGDIENNDTHTNGVVLDHTGIMEANSDHVLYLDGTSTAIDQGTVIDGFTITGGQADSNTAPHFSGGGLYCNGFGGQCSPTLRNLLFSGNLSDGLGNGNGGALYNQGGGGESSPTLEGVTFRGNDADGNGGAIYNSGVGGVSSPTITNATFFDNSSQSYGGAIYNSGITAGNASPVLTNVTFSMNSAAFGGAIANNAGTGTTAPTLTNVILWGDTATDTADEIHNAVNASSALTYSVVEGGEASIYDGDEDPFTNNPGNVSDSPQLGSLSNLGGFTPVIPFAPAGSSVLDNAVGGANCPPTDQRGVARPQGVGCDRGAYELIVADTVGINGSGTFYLRNANAAGPADNTFGFGWAGPTPLVGDWDGDGVSTVGIDDAGWFFLRNANSAGAADLIYQYGWAGATPLIGDWDGDGVDTIGIYDAGWFFLRNSNSPGPADLVFSFGWAGPTPLVGDWDADGVDTVGIYDAGWFFLRNSNSAGAADVTFNFGWAGPTPMSGDWDGDGVTTVGIDSAGTFFLRNSNSAGPADVTFNYGWGGATPLAGTWDLVP